MKTLYSVGFAVSLDGQKVLLLEKGRPVALKGKWMGVGGHIEEGETPFDAIVRESKEEADLDLLAWDRLCVVEREDATIYMHAAFTDLSQARTMTDEPVEIFDWDEVDGLPLSDATVEVLDLVRAFARLAPQAHKSPRP